MGKVSVTVLGPMSVALDGERLDLGKPQAQLVLAHLLSQEDGRLRRDELIERVWPDRDPGRARHSLNVHVSELRKRLPEGIELETTSDGYALRLPEDALDRARFSRLLGRGDLDGALDTWTGRAFAGLSDQPGIDQAAVALETTRRETLAAWAEAEIDRGRHEGLVGRLESALEVDPFDEKLCGLLMKAHYAAGAPAKALAVFQRIRQLLNEELGVVPGPGLQDLEEQVLLHDTRLPSSGRPAPSGVQLPTERTQLIGRDRDLSEILTRLEESQIVSIVGPGGAGKTRLALRVAHSLAEGGRVVYFAELGNTTAPDQIPQNMVAAMGFSDTRGSSSMDVLKRSLTERETVFVVDNCEHLIESAADVVDQMASWGPEVRILTTSREPLSVHGEVIWHLGPLEVPPPDATLDAVRFDAVALFVQRAESLVAGFQPETHLEAVTSLVRRLDGLPLAIELAAALLSSMSPSEIETALTAGVDILDQGRRTAPARHRSLEETIAWSERLMSADERSVFRRLSVFAGRFGVGSASVVCGFGALDPRQVRRLLARLVAKSLVVADTTSNETSFYLLETVRAVGRHRLESAGEAAETLERYLDVYQAGARDFGWMASSERRDEALRWAQRELDNITDAVIRLYDANDVERALTIASSLARVITALGRYRTVVDWIERGLSSPELPSVDPDVVAQARVVMAMAGAERDGSVSAGESAYRHFVESGIQAGAARAAYALAYNASLRGDLPSAERWSTLAVEQARTSESAATLAWVLPINVVYRLAVPRRDLTAEELAAAFVDLDLVDAVIDRVDNAELPICAAIARAAVRMLAGDEDPLAGIEVDRWVSDTPYYLPVAFDIMRAAAAVTTNDMDTATSLLIDAAESQQDSFQLPARKSMLKVYAACAVRLGMWELADRLFASAGDAGPVLVYGMFFDPEPYHAELRDRLGEPSWHDDAGALAVDDALDLFVVRMRGSRAG